MRPVSACILSVLTLIAVALAASEAEARRRGGIPIVVPGFSSSETLIKVRDLPKGAPFVDKDGQQIHLGYLWPKSGEGQWVGYVSSTRYYQWSPEVLEAVVAASGMGELPAVPEKPADGAGGSTSFLIIALIGCGAFWFAWKFLFRGRRGQDAAEASSSAWVSRAEGRMANPSTGMTIARVDARSADTGRRRAQRSPQPAALPRMQSGANGGRTGFGQRR